MTRSLRTLIGSILLMVFVAVYCLVMMVVATAVLPGAGGFTQLAFYAIAGLAWVPVAMVLISWMYRPTDRNQRPFN